MKRIFIVSIFCLLSLHHVQAQGGEHKVRLKAYIQQLRALADSLERQIESANFSSTPTVNKSGYTTAPDKPVHEPTFFVDSIGRVFWQEHLPVYMRMSPNPDGSGGTMLSNVKRTEMEAYSNPMKWENHGVHYIKHEDANPRESVEFPVYADGLPPNTQVLLENAPKYTFRGRDFYGKGLTITAITEDQLSGVSGTYQSINGTDYELYQVPFLLEDNLLYTLRFYGTDRVGNAETPKTLEFTVDLAAPITTLSLEGDRMKDILSPRASILLTSEDSSAGVAKILYSINGGDWKTYSQPIGLQTLAEGDYELSYYAIDNVKNQEKTQVYQFFLDKSSPQITAEVKGDQHQSRGRVYISSRTKMSLRAEDNKAGLDRIYYSIDAGTERLYREPFPLVKSEGKHIIKFTALDKVKNKGMAETNDAYGNMYLDLSVPEISHRFEGPNVFTRDTMFINQKTKIILESSDTDSGVKKTGYKLNDGRGETYMDPFSLEKDGYHKIDYYALDNVNNRVTDEFFIVGDNQGPEIQYSFSTNPVSSLQQGEKIIPAYPRGTTIFLAATDAQLGVENIFFSLDGRPEQIYAGPLKLSQKGLKSFKIRVTDELGNSTMSELIEIFIQ